jgi:hypothetical protein
MQNAAGTFKTISSNFRPLRRMIIGGLLEVAAFVICGMMQLGVNVWGNIFPLELAMSCPTSNNAKKAC